MLKYPRTSSTASSGYFDDEESMLNPYQTPPASPQYVPQYLQRHMVRMFSTEDASGTSAVAIDNKIEQAMDLVKSHLMIAVREEVEVLKERISELMDKINNLEVENTILKSNMSPETLQQLQMQIAGSQQPAAVAAPPATPAIQAPPVAAVAPASNAATSPATATAPPATIMPASNGSVADSGGNNGEAATVATNGAIAAPQSAVTAAAQPAAVSATTASVNTNGPMS